jgi:hypothetical protein
VIGLWSGVVRLGSHAQASGSPVLRWTTVGGCYGFKRHLVVNDEGELLAFKLTAGHVDDRAPVPALTRGLKGQALWRQGYISQPLFDELYERSVQLITR